MKLSTFLIITALTAGWSTAFAQNYGDDLDRNNMPSSMEDRENELGNTVDSLDENTVPSQLEEREQEEEVESDVIQTDDPEKTFDATDSEIDE